MSLDNAIYETYQVINMQMIFKHRKCNGKGCEICDGQGVNVIKKRYKIDEDWQFVGAEDDKKIVIFNAPLKKKRSAGNITIPLDVVNECKFKPGDTVDAYISSTAETIRIRTPIYIVGRSQSGNESMGFTIQLNDLKDLGSRKGDLLKVIIVF